ncbi:MAG: prephenate dehydrogenase [Nocardioidaceae bacterium]
MTESADAGRPVDEWREGLVLVNGAGMIGTSVAMGLTRAGATVHLQDVNPTTAHVAASLGGGVDGPLTTEPRLVVVATPPDQLGAEVATALHAHPAAVVTDVGSVKGSVLHSLRGVDVAGVDLSRYVGSHPMAGSERSGPLAAAADLFEGRTWALVPRPDCDPHAVQVVERMARACGASVVHMSAEEHDVAVARISHLPHVVAALAAGRLRDAPPAHLALSGQGVRDVTRVAAGDPRLWQQILTANAPALEGLLHQVRDDIDVLLGSLRTRDGTTVQRLLAAGVDGTTAIPGKHGQPTPTLTAVTVAIPDRPRALAELFADAGEAGVNIEDIRIDHDPSRAYGTVELDVAEQSAAELVQALRARDWAAHR